MEMTSEGASRGGGRREGGTMLTWRDDVAVAEGQTEMGEGGKEEGAGESAMAEGEAEGEHAEGGEERANPASPSIAPDAALATAFHAREQGADKAPEALRAASGDEEAAREAEGAERGVGMGDGRREGGEGGERGGEGGKEGSVDGRRDEDDRGEMGVGEGERRGLGGGEGEGQGGGEGGGNGGGERGKGGKEGEEREGVVRGKGGEWGWRWVDEKDASWPLYSAASCPFIFPGQNCRSNGRNDTRFERYAWRQGGERSGDGREDWGVREEVGGKERSWCDALRGVRHGRGEGAMTPNGMMTRVAYIGDSVMRNMFESMAHGGGVGGGGRGGGGRPMTRVAYIGDSMMRNMFESMACMLHSHPRCGDNPEVVRANVVERVIRWDTCNVTLANLSPFLSFPFPPGATSSPRSFLRAPRTDELRGATLYLSRLTATPTTCIASLLHPSPLSSHAGPLVPPIPPSPRSNFLSEISFIPSVGHARQAPVGAVSLAASQSREDTWMPVMSHHTHCCHF
ncbi:unnamed protein product [Closterium sp. Naga37s-1]|nr:unnamed protein product [Closterium sp. Naga37s-1]